jgi:NAD(P)-dependent dehydrogenase (short-subunit alcohol dehydrogenase family)
VSAPGSTAGPGPALGGPAGRERLTGRVAVVVGAGQTPGDTIGNGRAISVLAAREGARVLAVDRDLDSATETCELVRAEGGEAEPWQADITSEDDCRSIPSAALERFGRIDVLVNNVGIGTGDASATRLTEEAWDLIHDVNLKGMWLTCKHVVPVLREQQSGSVVNISSAAAVCAVGFLAYKTSKAAVNALTHSLAMSNARHGVRVNAVMPGLMDTPMAIESIAAASGVDRDELRAQRDRMVPLRGGMGTAWDVASAVLFLASDDAAFVTGVVLPVDGGQQARIG